MAPETTCVAPTAAVGALGMKSRLRARATTDAPTKFLGCAEPFGADAPSQGGVPVRARRVELHRRPRSRAPDRPDPGPADPTRARPPRPAPDRPGPRPADPTGATRARPSPSDLARRDPRPTDLARTRPTRPAPGRPDRRDPRPTEPGRPDPGLGPTRHRARPAHWRTGGRRQPPRLAAALMPRPGIGPGTFRSPVRRSPN